MKIAVFDSRDKFYKSKISAIAEGESVKLRVILPRSLQCHGAFLCVRRIDGETYERQGMFWAGMHGDWHEIWDITFEAHDRGVYCYHFELNTNEGVRFVSRAKRGLGELCGYANDFRQTVYRKDAFAQSSLLGGIVYQIFPDRFCFSGEKKENVPKDRILRDDWGGVPFYLPDKNGRVLNNDYFCGDFKGIESKLPYIKSLGATHIYLNPVFEAHSNHRYNTADFEKTDPLLGTANDFKNLCESARKLGIRIILDGVFSHVGSDSVYFDKEKRYGMGGAYGNEDSLYRSWFKFGENGSYRSWWGIDTLPEVDEENEDYIEYIEKIVEKWMSLGAGGWRLDVADELPDKFLDSFYKKVKSIDKSAPIICEVWENASDKISYGKRRRYLLGGQTDSVMNYPFSRAISDFVRFGDGEAFIDRIMEIKESYPRHILNSLMTHLSNHDTERFITKVGAESANGRDRAWQASQKNISEEKLQTAVFLLKAGAIIQYALPGVPSIYYGDEAGLQGYADPFNRGCYPWGRENNELIEFYRALGKAHSYFEADEKEFEPICGENGVICFSCSFEKKASVCAVNLLGYDKEIKIPNNLSFERELISVCLEKGESPHFGRENILRLPSNSAVIFLIKNT